MVGFTVKGYRGPVTSRSLKERPARKKKKTAGQPYLHSSKWGEKVLRMGLHVEGPNKEEKRFWGLSFHLHKLEGEVTWTPLWFRTA